MDDDEHAPAVMNATEERHLSPQGFPGDTLNKTGRPMGGTRSDGDSRSYQSHLDSQLPHLVFWRG